MQTAFPQVICVLNVVLVGLIAVMFIPNFMKTRELSDSFHGALSHAIGSPAFRDLPQSPHHL